MKPRRSLAAPFAIVLVAVLGGGWFLQQGVSQESNVYMQVRLLQEVVDHVTSRYVEPVEEEGLYQSAVDGVIESLGDPNTAFLRAEDYENLRIRTEGQYGGVGLEVTQRNDWVTVVTALPGTPATRAGVLAGDRIVEVEGESTEGWTVDEVVDVLRGPAGSEVQLRVRRPGVDRPIPFTVTRERIQLSSVPFATELSGGFGYVPLQLMSETSSSEVRAAIDSLRSEGMRGLVFDLRNNPGGLLDQGVGVADLFLPESESVVETRGRAANQSETFRAEDQASYEEMPVVVLVDGQSASAAEIVAGALQDHDRALVVGTPSFGKGSVQTLYSLTGGNVLKLTTARWYTPSGRSIEKERETDADGAVDGLEDPLTDETFGILTLQGSIVARPDTASRPTFESDAGRVLYGGGGITPDVIVLPDTLTREEEDVVRDLFESGGAFFTAVFNHSVQYIQDHPALEVGFTLTPAEMVAFHERLTEAGVEMEPEDYGAIERFVRYQLEREIANQRWGRMGEFRQTLDRDPQVQEALRLLGRSESPTALFREAGNPIPGFVGGAAAARD